MRELTVILPQTSDEIRREVQQSIQQAVRDARDAAREAARAGRDAAREGVAYAEGQPGPPPLDVATAVALVEAQVAAMNKEITDLTNQLNPGQSAAREQAIRAQLNDAVSRREDLREQMDQLLAGGSSNLLQPEFLPGEMIPPQAVTISIAFFVTCAVIAIGIPVARAWARWLDRRGRASPASPEMDQRLSGIEQAIEAVAIEVERVSEGQRYTNRNISELRGLPASNAGQGWPLPARDPVGVDRRSEG